MSLLDFAQMNWTVKDHSGGHLVKTAPYINYYGTGYLKTRKYIQRIKHKRKQNLRDCNFSSIY